MTEVIFGIIIIWFLSFLFQIIVELVKNTIENYCNYDDLKFTNLMYIRCFFAPIFLPISIISGLCWFIYKTITGGWKLIKLIPVAFLDFFNLYE